MNNNCLNLQLGERIRNARLSAGLTQAQLHELTQISITQLSNYENGSRNIGIDNLAKIAKVTGKTIDEIYLGTCSERPILSSNNEGELIVNCVTALVDKEVIGLLLKEEVNENVFEGLQYTYKICFKNYLSILDDYVKKLLDFEKNKNNYRDPDGFKKQLMDAVATEINNLNG